MRTEFNKQTKRDALTRSGGKCEAVGEWYCLPAGQRCNMPLDRGVEFDHIDTARSGNATLENCAAVCRKCHSHKTATIDTPKAAKELRQRDKHLGIKARSTFPKRVNAWSRT